MPDHAESTGSKADTGNAEIANSHQHPGLAACH